MTIDARAPDVAGQVREALGGSADIVFDCVAIQSSVDQAIAIADKGGTVVVVGVPAAEVTVPLPIVQDHQIRIQGSATYLPEDYAESAGLLAGAPSGPRTSSPPPGRSLRSPRPSSWPPRDST